ncbi:MAG: TetR/AcrR family transcriptional regulator [Proteobacteria bacterium]|nr:TetR/AcrR family transcriptional regulator [Pseudomonadota bacterium]
MTKRLNADIQKPKIIESFYQTILEEGFEGTSIAKIAARIDMKPTLIIHYFGTKENLTIAGVDHVITIYSNLLDRLSPRHEDPEKRLMALLNTLWSRAYYEKFNIAVAFSVISVSFRNTRIKKKIQILYQQFKSRLIKELEALHREGVIACPDAVKTADVLISMVEGSRHFRHFHVKAKDVAGYNQSMIMAALSMLKTPLAHKQAEDV